jgi:hypothetical protein
MPQDRNSTFEPKIVPKHSANISLCAGSARLILRGETPRPAIAPRVAGTVRKTEPRHIERMFEGFAILSAGIKKRFDGSFPELTEGLVGMLWPQFLESGAGGRASWRSPCALGRFRLATS